MKHQYRSQPDVPSYEQEVDCEAMRAAMLDSYARDVAGLTGDMEIRAAIVQALRETKVAARVLNEHLNGGERPDKKFWPSSVNIKLQPEHHETDRELDRRVKLFLHSLPTVQYEPIEDEEHWVVRRMGADGNASVDTIVSRSIFETEIDDTPRRIAHYTVGHLFNTNR